MASHGTFALTNADRVEMTLTITMSMKEWKIVKEHLRPAQNDGDWYLDNTISQMLDKANKEFHFYEEVTKAE